MYEEMRLELMFDSVNLATGILWRSELIRGIVCCSSSKVAGVDIVSSPSEDCWCFDCGENVHN